MRRLALALVAFVALLASAEARKPGPLERAQRVAERTWQKPCSGDVDVVRRDLPGRMMGFASWQVRDGRTVRCRVELDPRAWRSRAYLCTVVLHEYGHLAGRGHTRNRRSIMYPKILRVDRRCR